MERADQRLAEPRRGLFLHLTSYGPAVAIRAAWMLRGWHVWVITDRYGQRHEVARRDVAAIRFVDWPDTGLVA